MRILLTCTALAALAGCSKDATPTPNAIIETGYIECRPPADACDGVTTCVDDADAAICVQAQAGQCNEALTCACVGAWLCGDLPCTDLPDGVACGEAETPPPKSCLQVDALVDLGEQLIFDRARGHIGVTATCDAAVADVELVDGTPGAALLGPPPLPVNLSAGDRVEFEVELAPPEEPGEQFATIQVNGDPALQGSLRAQFVRPAGGGCLMAAPMQLAFGQVALGSRVDRSVQLTANCAGVLDAVITRDNPEPTADIEVLGLGPIEAGEGGEVIIRVTPNQVGPFDATITLSGVGMPIELTLTGEALEVRPSCDGGLRCAEGEICSALDECVTPIEFVIDAEVGANETWFNLPRGRYFEAVRIARAENPDEVMIPFMPCDACIAGPECGAQPAQVGMAGLATPFQWDGTRWMTDTFGDDCSRPEAMVPGDYLAIFCVSEAVELTGAMDPETGIAPGEIVGEFCLAPVPFTWPTNGPIVGVVPAAE